MNNLLENWKSCFDELLNTEYCCNKQSIAICGDSLEILKQVKSKSVNLIFADPPYNINKHFGNNKDSWNSVKDYFYLV